MLQPRSEARLLALDSRDDEHEEAFVAAVVRVFDAVDAIVVVVEVVVLFDGVLVALASDESCPCSRISLWGSTKCLSQLATSGRAMGIPPVAPSCKY